MKIYTQLLIIALFVSCCTNRYESPKQYLQDWRDIDTAQLDYKFGDYLTFEHEGFIYCGIIVDFYLDSNIHYGICFTEYQDTITPDFGLIKSNRLFGRKQWRRIDDKKAKCINCLDVDYIKLSMIDSNQNKIEKIGNIPIDKNKIKIGGLGSAAYYYQIFIGHDWDVKVRQTPPDDCEESRYDSEAKTEIFCAIDDIKK